MTLLEGNWWGPSYGSGICEAALRLLWVSIFDLRTILSLRNTTLASLIFGGCAAETTPGVLDSPVQSFAMSCRRSRHAEVRRSHPSRLETRTKESSTRASPLVENLDAK